MKTLKKTAAEMVASARAQIEEIETADLMAMASDPNVVIVDIREMHERERNGYIPGSVHAPRSMIEFHVDPANPNFKDEFAQEGKKFVFHCAAGGRSALTVQMLKELGFEASHLKEGFSDWQKQGGAVEYPDQDNGS